jgi:hypothetical protein
MSNSIAGPMLERIGQLIADIVPGDDLEGVWMYAEAGDQWVEASIFKDEGEAVRSWFITTELVYAILDLWDAHKAEGREWAVLIYAIDEGRFNARFQYADDFIKKLDRFELRPLALKERFGDKRVIYPELDKDRFYQPTLDELTDPDD